MDGQRVVVTVHSLDTTIMCIIRHRLKQAAGGDDGVGLVNAQAWVVLGFRLLCPTQPTV